MKEQVPSNEYSREYLLSTCDGYKDYNIYQGKKLPFRLQKAFALASPKSGMRILDYGCGRGELVR